MSVPRTNAKSATPRRLKACTNVTKVKTLQTWYTFGCGCGCSFGSRTVGRVFSHVLNRLFFSFSPASKGTLSTPLDRSDPSNFTIPVKCLPSDTTVPLIVHCRTGGRARMAKKNVAALQQYDTVHCCGLEEMNLLSNKIPKIIKCTTNLTLKDSGVFLQFQDPTSSTFTYLIGDKKSKECILIDPVLERLEHDLARIAALGLTLVYGINTHCHADHVTSTGQMKLKVSSVRPHL